MLDKDLYCFTSDFNSGIIIKTISNNKLEKFLNKINSLPNLIFDDELTQKIIELYGSLDTYKQKR